MFVTVKLVVEKATFGGVPVREISSILFAGAPVVLTTAFKAETMYWVVVELKDCTGWIENRVVSGPNVWLLRFEFPEII